MSNALAARETTDLSIMEQVIIKGDLAKLTPDERVSYYTTLCRSVGLNPLTKPFEYIDLDGKLTLYARKDAGDQLRQTRNVKITKIEKEIVDDVYVVTAHAETPDGRTDYDIGAVPLVKENGEWKTAQGSGKKYFQGNGTYNKLSPDARANAMMKAITKAKRRVTLSICGLGFLDETEVKDIPQARTIVVNESGEIVSDTNETAAPQQPASRVKASRAGMENRIRELFTQANSLELDNPEQWYDAVLEDMTDDEVLDFGKRFAAAIKDTQTTSVETVDA